MLIDPPHVSGFPVDDLVLRTPLNPKRSDFCPVRRFDRLPKGRHRQLGRFRIYRLAVPGELGHVDTIEALHEDEGGRLFWAPLPVVLG